MRADNTQHVVDAARQRAEQTRRRALAALQRMTSTGLPITFEAVASEARVSRSWLYSQDDLRAEIDRLRRRHPHGSRVVPPDRQHASDASLLHRLEAATARIRHLEATNQELRQALELALGSARTERIAGSPPPATRPPDGTHRDDGRPESPPQPAPTHRNATSTTPSTTHRRRSKP
jgi:hypothetical protein